MRVGDSGREAGQDNIEWTDVTYRPRNVDTDVFNLHNVNTFLSFEPCLVLFGLTVYA